MKQLCLTIALIFFAQNLFGASLQRNPNTNNNFQLQQNFSQSHRNINRVEKNVKQVEKNITRTINNQIGQIQRNIKTPVFKNSALLTGSSLPKGIQSSKVPSLAKGTGLLTKELTKVDTTKLLASPIILKSPIVQKKIKTSKKADVKKGLATAKNTPKTNKNLVNTPKVPKVVFVLPVPPVAKKIALPKSLVRR